MRRKDRPGWLGDFCKSPRGRNEEEREEGNRKKDKHPAAANGILAPGIVVEPPRLS